MKGHSYLPSLPENTVRNIAESIATAVGDEIVADVQSKRLITQNGTNGRIWDIIHTNLFNVFRDSTITARPSRRGIWEFLPFFDKQTGVLYCCMKEKNFKRLSKMETNKRNNHYLAAIAYSFNSDLPDFEQQLSLFPREDSFDERAISQVIGQILSDLSIPASIVRRHGLILFQNELGQLLSLHCCAINSSFKIVDSQNWSEFIPVMDSVVVETNLDPHDPHNNPTHHLSLSKKATNRIGRESSILPLSSDSVKKNDNK
ncbi:DUF5986 family protein [Pelotomaculum propionicicum]|uniref:Uncharacterized protein n=1 Tax=Pelotomaculum propionicicum TaxID=258475 RepID=A0A4Y7RKT5_9FIRM|nr:DUF5986 family protein [Pelotomaculum propionicicum]NLI12911.1 hypothetical protein [Peptococcaceae bacterium]TEB09608.1 hypothetical protein Pmgp_02977 [Pelotomaculum propionicicum]